jgi:orotate phosphoribosyltransferase
MTEMAPNNITKNDMTTDDVLDVFREAGALLEGHFILSSGRRSSVFLQKALIFKNPVLTEKLCKALAAKVTRELGDMPDVIVAPAMGGVIPGYETARHMGLESIFVEREDGEFRLRRGFTLSAGQKVLMVEDIVTTGLSSRECIASMNQTGARVIAGACLFDRSNGTADIGVPLISLAARKFPDYAPDDLPPELAAMQAIKPGSRGLTT